MNHRQANLPLNEPMIIPTVYLTGMSVEDGGHVLRFVGWEAVKVGEDGERRIVVRFAMPVDEARGLLHELAKNLPGLGN